MRVSVKFGHGLVATGFACAALLGALQEAKSADCKPGHFRAPYFLKDMGACGFDPETLSFAGTPVEQAKCLMRGMDATRNLAPPVASLPDALASRIGRSEGLPSRESLSGLLSKQNLDWDFAAYLWQPVSRARDNNPDAPLARYFVIHDTSGPNYGHRAFPDNIDAGAGFNNLANFACSDHWGRAHVFINRAGQMLVAHDYSMAWRETKFEQAAEFGGALKGLFLHNEMVQPRRSASGHGSRNDARSPDPAFTPAQYDRLALLYVIASVRAQHWLIPAFHAAIDADIPNGHDDPLNFNIQSFAARLDHLIDTLAHPEPIVASTVAPAADAPAADLALASATPASTAPAIDKLADDLTEPLDAASISEHATPAQAGSAPVAGAATTPDAAAASPTTEAAKSEPAEKPVLLDTAAATPPPKQEAHREQKTASAVHCETRRVKSRRHTVCEPERTQGTDAHKPAKIARQGRGKHAVHTAEGKPAEAASHTRKRGGEARVRHPRSSAKHGRA